MVAGGAAGAPVGTWTVLFTDQVGSTAMRVRLGERAFDHVRGGLDARMAAALSDHDVHVTKSTGDGVMGGFASTAAALRCAVAIQQAVDEGNRAADTPGGPDPVALRIGVSVGDAVVDDGDLQGTAVVEAARLCAAAGGGKILCSDAVRAVSANRSGCRFGPAFPMDLKGLPDPVLAREVLWDPLPERSAAERLAFRVLGPLEVRIDDRPVAVGGPKERTAVALLLARVNTSVPVDALLDAVWGERPPRTAERTLHAYVARLRRTLEPGRPHGRPSTVLATVGRAYELRLDAARLDALRFEELARRGSDELAQGADTAAATLREALGLWRGEAFAEFAEVEACAAASRRLDEVRLGLVEDRVDADLAAGRAGELVAEIESLVRAQPFRERRWALLMLALYRAGPSTSPPPPSAVSWQRRRFGTWRSIPSSACCWLWSPSVRRAQPTAPSCPRPRTPCTGPSRRPVSSCASPASAAPSTGAPRGRVRDRRARGLGGRRHPRRRDGGVSARLPRPRHRRQRRRLQRRRHAAGHHRRRWRRPHLGPDHR
jgi:DNA-binding SARP family transcriptional activator/class 3 adenylate cyclase